MASKKKIEKTKPAKKKQDIVFLLKKKYAPLQKKYSLPKFEDLDKEFKIYMLDHHTTDILFDIRRQISNCLHSFINVIYPIFASSDSDISSLIVSGAMDRKTKLEAHHFFKRLNYLINKGNSEALKGEKEIAAHLKELWKQWPEIKKQMIFFSEKLAKIWAKEYKNDNADVGYLG